MKDVRTDLDLPVVVFTGPAPAPKSKANGARASALNASAAGPRAPGRPGATDDHPTGQLPRNSLRSAVQNTLAQRAPDLDEFADEGPPPPVVIPPPRQRKPRKPGKVRTVRSRRRRRLFIGVIVALLIGGSVGYAGWWYGSGRFGQVPSLSGQTQTVAASALKHAGFELSGPAQTQFSDTVAKDMVISTQPGAGARVPHSRKVTLIVSKGKELFAIPTVVAGSSPDEAQALLGGVPVRIVASTSQSSDTIAAGKVIGTVPAGGTNVGRGDEVKLIISTGPAVLTVPDETAQAQAAATTALSGLGFKVAVKTDYSSTVPTGSVITQSPGPGESLAKFQTVTITVSKGHAPVVVPSVIGAQVASAKTTLQGLGLVVKVVQVPFASLNNVVTQDPGPGATVPFGSTVTVYIN
jgi:serine/threonine-protein kinase